MIELPQVTLVCADCAYHELAAGALRRSLGECTFGRAIFFTDRDIAVEGVETVRIAPLRSVAEYSQFILKGLAEHVRTSHVLVIQWDGFVLDGGAWQEEFLQYDYIGAVWPGNPVGEEVGNGGFSLRSRRLLEALRDAAIVNNASEDLVICRFQRPLLEQRYDVRYAPAPIARQFSFEIEEPRGATFGFHALYNFDRVYRDDAALLELLGRLPDHGLAKPETVKLIERLWTRGRRGAAQSLRDRVKPLARPMLEELVRLALTQHRDGNLRGAERACAAALAIDETHARALHLLGMVYGSTGRIDGAITLVRLALRQEPNASLYHSTLGGLLIAKGETWPGIASLRAAVDTEPDDPLVRRDLAEALQRASL